MEGSETMKDPDSVIEHVSIVDHDRRLLGFADGERVRIVLQLCAAYFVRWQNDDPDVDAEIAEAEERLRIKQTAHGFAELIAAVHEEIQREGAEAWVQRLLDEHERRR